MGEFVVLGLVVLMLALLAGTVIAALSRGRTEDPAALLAERYAKGEITEQEYTRRLSILTYGPPILLPPDLPDLPESGKDPS